MSSNKEQKENKFEKKFSQNKFSLRNEQNGLVIDIIRLGNEQNKAIIWQPDGGLTQTFCFQKAQDGFFIKSLKDDDLYWTIDNQQNGSRLYVTSKNLQNKNQVFQIQKQQADQFIIKTFCGKILEISNGGTDKGTHIVQGENKKQKYQIWKLTQPKPFVAENEEEQLQVGQKAKIQQAKQGGIGLNQ